MVGSVFSHFVTGSVHCVDRDKLQHQSALSCCHLARSTQCTGHSPNDKKIISKRKNWKCFSITYGLQDLSATSGPVGSRGIPRWS